jgi:SRSO17 transposase
MPEHWFSQAYAEKRKRVGVAEELPFKTEPQLALDMLCGIVERQTLEFRWVTADEHYGMNPDFLDGVARLGKYYFAEVPLSTMVWARKVEVLPPGKGKMGGPRSGPLPAKQTPPPQQVRQIAGGLPARAWNRYTIKEGSRRSWSR